MEITRNTSKQQLEHLKRARETKKRLREERLDVLSQTSEDIAKVHNNITDIVADIAEIRSKVSQLHTVNKPSDTFAVETDAVGVELQPSKKQKKDAANSTLVSLGKVSSIIAAAVSIVYGIWGVLDLKEKGKKTLPWAEHEFLADPTGNSKKPDFNII